MEIRPGQTWRIDAETSFYVDEVDDEKAVGTMIVEAGGQAFSAAAFTRADFAGFELLADDG
ncbi:MAG: hypothetical protein U0R70_15125 [Solirubrobacteraceae bacterium]